MEATNQKDPDGVPAIAVNVKEEPQDESAYENRPVEFVNVTVSKSANAAGGRFVDDIEIGETRMSFHNGDSDEFGASIKTEILTTEESDIDRDCLRTRSTGAIKRKGSIHTQQYEGESSTSKRQDSVPRDCVTGHTDAPTVQAQVSYSDSDSDETTYLLTMLEDSSTTKDSTNKVRIVSVTNGRARDGTGHRQPSGKRDIPKSSDQPEQPSTSNAAETKECSTSVPKPCTHCPCFDKFVSAQQKTLEQFLVNQQKVVAEILNVQQSILHRLDARDARAPEDSVQRECHLPNEIPLFSFTAIKNHAELEDFEEKLNDCEYLDEVLNWLNSIIEAENARNRMQETLDLIFDKRFLIQCSWTGIGKSGAKIPMMRYKNVYKLFQEIGCTYSSTITPRDVTNFLISKLKHAKERAKALGLRKSTCRVRRKFCDYVE